MKAIMHLMPMGQEAQVQSYELAFTSCIKQDLFKIADAIFEADNLGGFGDARRSLSTGDVLELEGKLLLCLPAGWCILTAPEYEEWKALPWMDRRAVYDYADYAPTQSEAEAEAEIREGGQP